MSDLGYVVREEHVRVAIDKATPDEARHLHACVELVAELNVLARSFADRLQEARAQAGIEMPRPSRSAAEAVSQSFAAHQEYDRLLSRRCNRAPSASAVVQELLTAAEDELEFEESLAEYPVDEPCRRIVEEHLQKKRELVSHLKRFPGHETL